MVVSNKEKQFCLHYNRESNKECFLVCKDCGIVLDEAPNMVNDDPYFQTYTHFNHMSFHRDSSPLLSTTIGSESERRNVQKFKRYSQLNKSKYTYTETLKIKTLYETKRLLALLQLPNSLKKEVIKKVEFFYSQFRKATKFRGVLYLTPFILYITCLERNIFIDKKKIIEFSALDIKIFNQLFISILRNNKTLQEKLRDNDFRKDQILNSLSGYIDQKKNSFNKKGTVDLILEYLEQTPAGLTGKELSKRFDFFRTTIPHHLRTLKNKGFIYSDKIKRKGRPVNCYKINPDIHLNLNQDSYSFKELLETAQKFLDNYWNLFKKYSNRAITSVIFSLARDCLLSKATQDHLIFLKHFTDHSISIFLGIEQSTLTSTKKNVIKLIEKIKGKQNESKNRRY